MIYSQLGSNMHVKSGFVQKRESFATLEHMDQGLYQVITYKFHVEFLALFNFHRI